MTHVMPHELLQLIGKHGIIYDKQYLDQLMRIKVPFEKIIIKYTTNGWYGILNEWYNKTHSIRITIPKLKTRKYIKIIEKFMKIEIDACLKDSPITLDDILFATRGLMVDGTRTIDNYKILKITKKTLYLEPEIDNYST